MDTLTHQSIYIQSIFTHIIDYNITYIRYIWREIGVIIIKKRRLFTWSEWMSMRKGLREGIWENMEGGKGKEGREEGWHHSRILTWLKGKKDLFWKFLILESISNTLSDKEETTRRRNILKCRSRAFSLSITDKDNSSQHFYIFISLFHSSSHTHTTCLGSAIDF